MAISLGRHVYKVSLKEFINTTVSNNVALRRMAPYGCGTV